MKADERALWMTIVALGAIPWACAAVACRLGVRPFGPPRNRAVPWTIFDVLLLAPMACAGVLRAVLVRAGSNGDSGLDTFEQVGLIMAVSLPILLVAIRGAKLYQLGLHCSHFTRDALLGVAAYLLAMPLVALAYLIAARFFTPTPHRIAEELIKSPTLQNMLFFSANAVIVAPLLEELLFRGILLPWMRRTLGVWPAIVGSSLVFAALHCREWPAPIPLFVFALFLGYLAYRTTSLVAPVTLHATFNAVSMILLVVMIRSAHS